MMTVCPLINMNAVALGAMKGHTNYSTVLVRLCDWKQTGNAIASDANRVKGTIASCGINSIIQAVFLVHGNNCYSSSGDKGALRSISTPCTSLFISSTKIWHTATRRSPFLISSSMRCKNASFLLFTAYLAHLL